MKEVGSGRLAPTTRKVILAIALVLILVQAVALGAGALGFIELGNLEKATVGSGTRQVSTPAEASQALNKLQVASPGSMSGYSRERFPHWSKASDFGWAPPDSSCDTREAALLRDGKNVKVGKGCKVASGEWPDSYTGQTYSDPKDLDIDHVVPLANAWRSGASSWNDKQRERYANDPEVLLSVEDNANQAKGDKGPEAWKPPNKSEWCDFAERWIQIKSKYDLSVNEQEKTALEQMFDTCTGS
jgi:Protein of unknown function (DUF1524)